MKHHAISTAVLLFLSGCGGSSSGDDQPDTPAPSELLPQLNSVAVAAGDQCINGGQQLNVGFDSNGNGELEHDEITDSQLLCNSADGQAGISALFDLVDEPSGDQCAAGGLRIDSGLDYNSDGVLAGNELLSQFYLCHGTSGFSGQDGYSSLVAISTEPNGSNCANGGTRIDSGIDNNRNQQLDSDEVSHSQYVCNGSSGASGNDGSDGSDGSDGNDGQTGFSALVSVAPESAGANCANGGNRIDVGLDSNRNDVLDADEISSTQYLCHGNQGPSGNDGDDGQDGENGLDGFNALVTVTEELAGANCSNGGNRIDAGIDRNRNGELDSDEISSTQYICNGDDGDNGEDGDDGSDGSDGQNGFNTLVNVTAEAAGANCANGGSRIDVGMDSNRNDLLDDEEIQITQYVCNGADYQPLEISVTGTTVSEDDDQLLFTVALSEAQQETVSLSYGTVDVTASAGTDYEAVGGVLTFAPGETSQNVAVPLLQDAEYECNEMMLLLVNSDSGNVSGFGQITDNGEVLPQASVSFAQPRVYEDHGDVNAVIRFEHRLCNDQTLTIDLAGDATNGSDYTPPETLTLIAGEREYQATFNIIDDSDKEELETIELTLSNNDIDFTLASASLGIEPVPAEIVGSYYSTCAVFEDGLVRCWGYNSDFQLGTGHNDDIGDGFGEGNLYKRCDEEGEFNIARVVELESGGDNCTNYGGIRTEYGDDTNRDGILDDDEVEAGVNRCHTASTNYLATEPQRLELPQWCANGGTMLFYGRDDNGNGVLDGTTLPEQLSSAQFGDLDIAQLAVGGYHTCLLLADDTVRCLGSNSNGRMLLGTSGGDIGDDPAELGNDLPQLDFGTDRTVTQLSLGDAHSCVILDDQSLKCWGSGNSGRLGHGDITSLGDSLDEIGDGLPVVDLGTDEAGQPLRVKQVSAGYRHTCAILADDTVKCWGDGQDHALGNDNPESDSIGDEAGEMGNFLAAIDLGTDATPIDVYTGYQNTCVAFDNGGLKCWGENDYGQGGIGRGDEHIGDHGQDWSYSFCGNGSADIVVAAVEKSCSNGIGYDLEYFYDDNGNGSYDDGEHYWIRGYCLNSFNDPLIHQITEYPRGSAECSGNGGFDWIAGADTDGDGLFSPEMGEQLPFIDVKTSAPLKKLVLGYYSVCALFEDHTLNCWGDSTEGSAGLDSHIYWGEDAGETAANAPEVDLGTDRYAVDIAGGGYQMCALLDNHQIKCWGYSEYGEGGNPLFYELEVGNGLDEDDIDVKEMGDNLPALELF